ncbi:hypothetical protein ACFLQ0_00410 [Nitrospinota bacterium]
MPGGGEAPIRTYVDADGLRGGFALLLVDVMQIDAGPRLREALLQPPVPGAGET